MSRSITRYEGVDKKKVQELTLEYKLAEEAVLDGQVVSLGTTDGCVIPCTDQTIPYGVALNGVTAAMVTAYEAETVGEDKIEVIVAMQGFTRVLGGETLDANMWVSVDANGRVYLIWKAAKSSASILVIQRLDSHYCFEVSPADS